MHGTRLSTCFGSTTSAEAFRAVAINELEAHTAKVQICSLSQLYRLMCASSSPQD